TPPIATTPFSHVGSSLLPEEDGEFLTWVFSQARMDACLYRSETLARRIPACLRALRAATVGQAKLLIQRSPDLLPVAINSLIIGVTSFFRDPEVFAVLRDRVLAEMASGNRCIRI